MIATFDLNVARKLKTREIRREEGSTARSFFFLKIPQAKNNYIYTKMAYAI